MHLHVRRLTAFGFLSTLALASPAMGWDIEEVFDDGGDSLGTTDARQGGRWVEVGDWSDEDWITVTTDGAAGVVAFTDEGNLALNAGGLVTQDLLVFEASFKPGSSQSAAYGLGYRLPAQDSLYPADGGYWVRLDCDAGQLTLEYGGSVLATYTSITLSTSTYATIRVEANGTSHDVFWVENSPTTPVISETHSGRQKGYMGVFADESSVIVDDVSIEPSGADELARFDDFERSASDDVGPISVAGHSWVEVDNANDDLVKVDGYGSLSFHYFRSAPTTASLAANVDDFEVADFEARAVLDPYSDAYGGYYGIGYRLPSDSATYKTSGGYYAQMDANADEVKLWYGSTLLDTASAFIPLADSELRVVAQGDQHRIYVHEGVLADDFDRADDQDAGDLSDAQRSWVEYGDGPSSGRIEVYDDALDFRYFNPESSSPSLAAIIDGYRPVDVDITVEATPDSYNSYYYAGHYGVAYRLDTTSQGFKASDGYYVELDKASSPNTVKLWFENTEVASAEVTLPSGALDIRVVAEGPQHSVWLDLDDDGLWESSEEVIRVQHAGRVEDGHVGLFAWYSHARFDDFSVTELNPEPVLEVEHSGNTSAGPLGLFAFYSIVEARDFTASRIVNSRPGGETFPLLAYSMSEEDDLHMERAFGWNVSHSYPYPYTHLRSAHAGGRMATGVLPADTSSSCSPYDQCEFSSSEIDSVIEHLAHDLQIWGWELPEELRWWYQNEEDILWNYSEATRCPTPACGDPLERPVFMYIPSHYEGVGLADYYIDYLDVVSVAMYRSAGEKPPAWIRWRMEDVADAIDSSWSHGDNWLSGEKTQMGVMELYHPSVPDPVDASAAYHAFWQAIVSGARGLALYKYAYDDNAGFREAWDKLCRAASELTGPEDLHEVILHGTDNSSVGVTMDPYEETESFHPTQDDEIGDPGEFVGPYPALDVRAWDYGGETLIIVVNSSSDTTVYADVTGLGAATSVEVLFEGRTEAVSSGEFADVWAPEEVHIYKID